MPLFGDVHLLNTNLSEVLCSVFVSAASYVISRIR